MRGTNAFIRSVTIRAAVPAKGSEFQVPSGIAAERAKTQSRSLGNRFFEKDVTLRARSVGDFVLANESLFHTGESFSNFPPILGQLDLQSSCLAVLVRASSRDSIPRKKFSRRAFAARNTVRP